MRTLPSTLLAGAVAILATSCAKQTIPLEPANPETPLMRSQDATRASNAGVEVLAQAEWPGRQSVLDDVTPVHLTIENESDRELRLTLRDIELVDDGGDEYAALPLYEIDGEAAVRSYAYEPTPDFYYDDFYVMGPYADLYPGIGVYGNYYNSPLYDGYYADPIYNYGGYYGYWRPRPLPTPEMVNRAIPEGVIMPGGSVQGYVYFERVDPDDANMATLQYTLVDAKTGEAFGDVELDFYVVYQPT